MTTKRPRRPRRRPRGSRGATHLAGSLPSPERGGGLRERLRLPERKGEELIGLLCLVAGLLLAGSLVSHHPGDPSLLADGGGGDGVDNWIGPLGAQISALILAFVGFAALLFPILLLISAWRRLRREPRYRVPGRGLGALVAVAALPPFLHLAVGEVAWRGGELDAGGVYGRLLGSALAGQIGFAGALLVGLGGVVIGFALLVQSSLGDLLEAGNRRLRTAWESLRLARARRAERRERERSRRRVLAKHLERVRAERGGEAPATGATGRAAAPRLPDRVVERRGAPGFALRRGSVPPPPASADEARAAKPAGARSRPPRGDEGKGPQPALPFSDPPATAGALPPVNLLRLDAPRAAIDENELVRRGELIRRRCEEFGVEGTIEGIAPGPVITVFEFQPAPGVKVSQIVNLQDDLALALKAEAVRIERMAGRSTLGIEVPNDDRATIRLGHLLDQESFRHSPSLLTMAIGTTIHGEPYYADLATMPHLLVAGATGSGKSVGLQAMITSILYKARREQVQFIFIDPKRIELGVYGDVPHLKAEVVMEPKKASNALRWAVGEMERRYRLLAEVHVRSIDYYNRAIRDPEVQRRLALADDERETQVDDLEPLPYYVVVIDELADLMLVAASEVESSIARLAQMARAVGIHLIVATQRPSVDILTGTIKANFPCRMAFATASRHDSRTILDQVGAEKLLGRGDMLFMPPGTSRLLRLHGAYVSEQETAGLVRWLKKQGRPELDPEVLKPPEDARGPGSAADDEDELFDEAARLVVAEGQGSASFLQRRLRIGFSRAARLIDMMEADGLLGPPQGSKPRNVLVKADHFAEWDAARRDDG